MIVGVTVLLDVEVDVAVEDPWQLFKGEALLRGVIVGELEKSLALLSVSTHPLLLRVTLEVLLGAVVGPGPSKQFAVPKPTKSTTDPPVGQDPVRAVVELTR